jgi:tetratricopeptide (TPR) repeat protein
VLAIPTSLRDSLLARLDRLASVKEIVQIGACIGREFSYKLLAALSTLKAERLEEALEKLTKTGLVFRRGTPPDATYTFKHALVQDAAHDSLLKSKRAQFHAQIAQVLEKDFSERVANEPELLAQHYAQSGNPAMAIPWWRKAGELAVRRVALQEAVAHFQKGLALIEQLPPSSERDKLELSIREPLNGAWIGWRGWPASEVGVNATAILELAKNQGTPESLLMGLYGLWISTLTQGRVADALGWAERLLAEGDKAGDIDLQILGHTATMISHFYLGQLLAAREHGKRGVALYDPQRADRWMQLTGHDTRTVFLGWSAHWTWMLGYPDQAVQMSNEQDAHARRLGHALNLGYALTVGAYPFDYRCEPEQLVERVREADRLAREQSIPILYEVMVPQVEGLARLRSRHLSESIFLLRQGIENWNRLGGHTRVPYLKSALAEALALQGDLDAALEMIGESLEQIERPGWQERSHLAEVLRLKGWMLMRQGRDDEAETVLRASIDWARQQQAKSWELRSSTTLAQLLLERGQRDAAREVLAPIYNWFTEGFDTHDLTAARTLLEALR